MLHISEVEDFVRDDYEAKDTMHDLSHIRRILRSAEKLARYHPCNLEVMTLGAYFHGIIHSKEPEVRDFLARQGLSQDKIDLAVQIAHDSQKENVPQTLEGTVLHDAHLIEGGKTFLITKSLVTGTARGQTLEDTLHFFEQNVLGKHHCYLAEAQSLYEEKERYARDFLVDLKSNL